MLIPGGLHARTPGMAHTASSAGGSFPSACQLGRPNQPRAERGRQSFPGGVAGAGSLPPTTCGLGPGNPSPPVLARLQV